MQEFESKHFLSLLAYGVHGGGELLVIYSDDVYDYLCNRVCELGSPMKVNKAKRLGVITEETKLVFLPDDKFLEKALDLVQIGCYVCVGDINKLTAYRNVPGRSKNKLHSKR